MGFSVGIERIFSIMEAKAKVSRCSIPSSSRCTSTMGSVSFPYYLILGWSLGGCEDSRDPGDGQLSSERATGGEDEGVHPPLGLGHQGIYILHNSDLP